MDKKLDGKVMVVTGASSGVGKELSRYFAELGMDVIGIARRKDKLIELEKEIKNNNGSFGFYALDVTDYYGIKNAVDDIKGKYGRIDILVNNAGVGKSNSLENLTQEDIDCQIDTNLKGTIYCTRLVAPVMMEAKSGFIINISSTAGTLGLKSNGIYFASKHGVNGFADSISKYLIDYNIKVVTLCPGGIDTPWYEGENEKYEGDKNTLIKPVEIAKLIEFILQSQPQVLYRRVIFFPTGEANVW